jgi:hypothetical protein
MSAQGIRHVIRRLMKRPGVAVLFSSTLAIGVGANAGIFAVVRSVILQSPPYPHGDRVLTVGERSLKRNSGAPGPASTLNYLDWKVQSQAFQTMAATSFQPVTVGIRSLSRLGSGAEPPPAQVQARGSSGPSPPGHSARSAWAGSILTTVRAASHTAAKATVITTTGTTTNTVGSC